MIVDMSITFESFSKDKQILRKGDIKYFTYSDVNVLNIDTSCDCVGTESIIVTNFDVTSTHNIFLTMTPVEGLQIIIELAWIVPDEVILINLLSS